MDLTDPSSGPWNFRPEGYLVVISRVPRRRSGRRLHSSKSGFAPRDIKLYTGDQILDNHEEYMRRRSVTNKAVGSVADDAEGRELYLGYAREDRSALWLRLPARYYGSERQTDFHIS